MEDRYVSVDKPKIDAKVEPVVYVGCAIKYEFLDDMGVTML
jgi:hypothetical protein